jgi:hypothetical protein
MKLPVHDLAALVVATVLAVGMVVLAIKGTIDPTTIVGSFGLSIGWVFRASTNGNGNGTTKAPTP